MNILKYSMDNIDKQDMQNELFRSDVIDDIDITADCVPYNKVLEYSIIL